MLETEFGSETAEQDSGRPFEMWQMMMVSNHGSFSINDSYKYLKPAHYSEGQWIATIVHGFDEEG